MRVTNSNANHNLPRITSQTVLIAAQKLAKDMERNKIIGKGGQKSWMGECGNVHGVKDSGRGGVLTFFLYLS